VPQSRSRLRIVADLRAGMRPPGSDAVCPIKMRSEAAVDAACLDNVLA